VSGAAEPLPGIDARETKDAAVSPDGLVVFTTNQPIAGSSVTDRLHVYDPKLGTRRPLLAENRFLDHPSWGPGGRIAVHRATGQQGQVPDIAIVEPDGQVRYIPLSPPPSTDFVQRVLWGPSDVIAVAYAGFKPATVLLNPDTGEQRVFHGWHAVAWSPDGTTLLVQREDELVTLQGPDYDDPRTVGRAPSHVFGATWLPCDRGSSCSAAPREPRAPATGEKQLDLGELERLAEAGLIQTADIYSSRRQVVGRYIAENGTEGRYSLVLPRSVTVEALLQKLFENQIPVTVHDP
jgi:hypothetical protein